MHKHKWSLKDSRCNKDSANAERAVMPLVLQPVKKLEYCQLRPSIASLHPFAREIPKGVGHVLLLVPPPPTHTEHPHPHLRPL
jgi:hypothetical protein